MILRFCCRSGGLRVRACLLAATLFAVALPVSADGAESGSDTQMTLGREVFTKLSVPQCGLCHTLADAGTTGEIGPRLEELRPSADRVTEAVRKGVGVMPPFEGKLTEEQIRAVAHYVSRAAAK